MGNLAPRRFILFSPEFADFVGDLLRSFRQTSSVSVRKQNPTIPRPERNYEFKVISYEWLKLKSRLEIRLLIWKWNLCSFPWWKEPKIKAEVWLLKRKFRFYGKYRSEALYFVHSWIHWFCRWSSAKLPTNLSVSVRQQNPTIPRPKRDYELEVMIYKWN